MLLKSIFSRRPCLTNIEVVHYCSIEADTLLLRDVKRFNPKIQIPIEIDQSANLYSIKTLSFLKYFYLSTDFKR